MKPDNSEVWVICERVEECKCYTCDHSKPHQPIAMGDQEYCTGEGLCYINDNYIRPQHVRCIPKGELTC